MPPYRLFVTDLDGTLLGRDLRVSAQNREALARLAARGCQLAIATGRMVASATPYARELDVTVPIVTYNGAWIRCLETETDLLHAAIPASLAAEATESLEAAGLHVNLYLDDRLHVTAVTPAAEAYMAHARVEPVVCGSWGLLGACAPTKILAIGDPAHVREVLAALKPRFAGRLWLTQSTPTFLEITSAHVNKGTALVRLATHLGISQDEVVAVGDGLNDAEMLHWAGLGVAMGNADPALKARADRVTASVQEDGVARLIDDLIAEGVV